MDSSTLPTWFPIVITLIAIWSIPWKAVALWKSARNNDLVWFIVLMVVNTVGILEILYIYLIGKKTK
jgi:methionyl-tRNA synthetase